MHSQSFTQQTKASPPYFQPRLPPTFRGRAESLGISPVKRRRIPIRSARNVRQLRAAFPADAAADEQHALTAKPLEKKKAKKKAKTHKPFRRRRRAVRTESPPTLYHRRDPPAVPAAPWFPPDSLSSPFCS